MSEYSVDVIDVKRDGSCFFSAIALAMNQSIEKWRDYNFLRIRMEDYWNSYVEEHGNLKEVTPELIRYICSENIDEDIFETHCILYSDRDNNADDCSEKFDSIEEMKEGVLNDYWGDHSVIQSFFKAFNNRCALVIFDLQFGGIVYFQKEWTKGKDLYICIQRDNNHYKALRFCKGDKKLDMCIGRKTMMKFKKDVNNIFPGKIKNEY